MDTLEVTETVRCACPEKKTGLRCVVLYPEKLSSETEHGGGPHTTLSALYALRTGTESGAEELGCVAFPMAEKVRPASDEPKIPRDENDPEAKTVCGLKRSGENARMSHSPGACVGIHAADGPERAESPTPELDCVTKSVSATV